MRHDWLDWHVGEVSFEKLRGVRADGISRGEGGRGGREKGERGGLQEGGRGGGGKGEGEEGGGRSDESKRGAKS